MIGALTGQGTGKDNPRGARPSRPGNPRKNREDRGERDANDDGEAAFTAAAIRKQCAALPTRGSSTASRRDDVAPGRGGHIRMTAQSDASLLVQRDGETLRLTLNRPHKANALDASLVDALLERVQAAWEDGTRLLVLQAEGRHFCAGFDFTGIEDCSEGDLLLRFVRIEQLLQSLHHAPYATAAFGRGRILGAGADLFVACETRVAAPQASFAFPGARFGLVLGTRRLAARIGAEAARRIITGGVPVDLAQALAFGLATESLEPAHWPQRAEALALQAGLLDPVTRAQVHRATVADSRAEDMAALVASASRPGLKGRIRAYRS